MIKLRSPMSWKQYLMRMDTERIPRNCIQFDLVTSFANVDTKPKV